MIMEKMEWKPTRWALYNGEGVLCSMHFDKAEAEERRLYWSEFGLTYEIRLVVIERASPERTEWREDIDRKQASMMAGMTNS